MGHRQWSVAHKAVENEKFLKKKEEQLEKGEITKLDFETEIAKRQETYYSVPDRLNFKKLKNSKISKRRIDEILELMDKGYPKTTAAQEAGISKPTLSRWHAAGETILKILAEGEEKGEDPKKYYKQVTGYALKREGEMLAEFVMNLERRLARQEKKSLDKLRDSQDWRAHAWILEKMYPDKYGDKGGKETENNIQINVNFEGSDVIDITPKTDG